MNYFVTAIGTDSGKTVVSAILTAALKADYWKPVQAGQPYDSDTIRSLVPEAVIHKEAHVLQTPASPHAAAKIDGIEIDPNQIAVPTVTTDLIIEGAGGALVPINDKDLIIDLVPKFSAEVILVSNLYLGSINHTLLTVELLKSRGYPVKGIIFNDFGGSDLEKDSMDVILKQSGYNCLITINKEQSINSAMVQKYAQSLADKFEV